MKLEYDLKMALGTLYFIKLTRGRRRRKNSTVYKWNLTFLGKLKLQGVQKNYPSGISREQIHMISLDQLGQVGPITVQTVQNGPNGPKWSKWSKMVQTVQNGPNGPKWSKTVQNGPKRSKIVQNGLKRSKRSKMVQSVKMVQNYLTWSKTVQIFHMHFWYWNFRKILFFGHP